MLISLPLFYLSISFLIQQVGEQTRTRANSRAEWSLSVWSICWSQDLSLDQALLHSIPQQHDHVKNSLLHLGIQWIISRSNKWGTRLISKLNPREGYLTFPFQHKDAHSFYLGYSFILIYLNLTTIASRPTARAPTTTIGAPVRSPVTCNSGLWGLVNTMGEKEQKMFNMYNRPLQKNKKKGSILGMHKHCKMSLQQTNCKGSLPCIS